MNKNALDLVGHIGPGAVLTLEKQRIDLPGTASLYRSYNCSGSALPEGWDGGWTVRYPAFDG